MIPSFKHGIIMSSTPAPVAAANDVTPNAVNWDDPTAEYPASIDTINQTINGINTTISLTINIVANDGLDFYYSKNDGAWIILTDINGDPISFSISNGDTLKFRGTPPSVGLYGVIEIINSSDSNNILDTITFVSTGGGAP